MLAGLTVCFDLNTKQWIQVTHNRHPMHTSLLKLAAQKQTQFASNNTELDLASHGSYGPENGKEIHELCISINLSFLSLVVLHNWQQNCWFCKETWSPQNANLHGVVFCSQYVANAGKAMFFSCLTPFHEDIHGTMVVTWHTSRSQLRVSIWPPTMKITVFWGKIPCSLNDRYECFCPIPCLHFQPSLLPWRWKQQVHPNAHPVAGTNLASGCRQAEGYRGK